MYINSTCTSISDVNVTDSCGVLLVVCLLCYTEFLAETLSGLGVYITRLVKSTEAVAPNGRYGEC